MYHMFITLAQILQYLISLKYLIVFPLVMFEGPIVTVITGFLCAQGIMNVYLAFVVIVIGDLSGDLLYYGAGRWSTISFFQNLRRLVGLTPEKLEQAQKQFHNHSLKVILLGKLAHGIGALSLVSAGMARMKVSQFLWYNLIGTIPKSGILLLIGYHFGDAYAKISKYLDNSAWIGAVLGAIFVVIYLVITRVTRKMETKL
jgi:membrane protein DedA with SNARE-associated domain